MTLEALDRAAHSDVGDAKSTGEIDGTSFAGRGDEVGDQLHVILRGFLGVLFAGARPGGRGRGARRAVIEGSARCRFHGIK